MPYHSSIPHHTTTSHYRITTSFVCNTRRHPVLSKLQLANDSAGRSVGASLRRISDPHFSGALPKTWSTMEPKFPQDGAPEFAQLVQITTITLVYDT